ncbi:MAG: PrgI family protein [Clostridia bacterium]|nr:PrgI family protein [Clostridia bacterium]
MQIYKVPYNFRHEEKVFGGYASLRQGIYLILAIFSLGIVFIPNLLISIKVVLTAFFISIFALFAFLKIEEINADKYFINILKYLFRKKIYIYER